MAIPDTWPLVGTPASISERLEEQTDAIDVEPFDDMTSETRRSVYAKSSWFGMTGRTARAARAPWPISRRFGEPTRPVSPLAHGAML
jgi:hypothetical protein